ncbi:unnamed protein product [Bemisia tabaci]|nr:unnamed protein product [Bemisia tabaci]
MLCTWQCCSQAIPQPKSNEQPNWVEIYEKTAEVLATEVKLLLNFMYFLVNTTFKDLRTDKENKETADLAVYGLQLLSEWSSVVTELYSRKLLHLTDHHQNEECPQKAEEYERVSNTLQLHGRGKICANRVYCNAQRPASFNVSYGNLFYRSHQTQYLCRTPGLCASPSSTQLYMVRTMLQSLIAYESGGERTLWKEIDGQYQMQIDQFHKTLYYWNHLLGFSGFIGLCHMRHMCRLLDYQGIAVVMEELLQIVKLLIQGNLLQFTKTLMEAMLKTCKLPRYAYGSPGGLGYYHAQLNDIVQYPDARTELFHNFRELGDIILFCLLMEQTLVGNVQIVHTGAFQNILPRPFCKEGEKPEVKSRKLEAKFNSLHVVTHVEKLGSAKPGGSLKCARETQNRPGSKLISAREIENRLARRDCVQERQKIARPVSKVCERDRKSPREPFSEGLNWAGYTMFVLLGQQCRFEALDFCYLILRAQRVDGKDENVKGINLKRMVDQIRRFQVLNKFATLNNYLKSSEHNSVSVEHVCCFPPPIHPSLAVHAHYYRSENLQSQTVHNLLSPMPEGICDLSD